MLIYEAIKWAITKIKNKNINSAIFDAEILLSFILKKPREYLYAYPEKELTKKQISKFRFLISQRIKGRPVPYLTNHQEFFGLDFYVDKNVLIPRPETEILVEEALKHITQAPKRQSSKVTIFDIGTGSGCIVITLAKHLPEAKLIATDISKNALKIAKKNAQKHKVLKQIKFLQGDLLKPYGDVIGLTTPTPCHPSGDDPQGQKGGDGLKISPCSPRFAVEAGPRGRLRGGGSCPRRGKGLPAGRQGWWEGNKKQILILANLPYLTKKQLKNVPFEPQKALYGGKNGLEYYKKLFKQIHQLIRRERSRPFPTKTNIILFLEISPDQTKPLKSMIKKYLPNKEISFIKDLSGRERIIKIE